MKKRMAPVSRQRIILIRNVAQRLAVSAGIISPFANVTLSVPASLKVVAHEAPAQHEHEGEEPYEDDREDEG